MAAFRCGIKKTPQKPQKVICLANYPFCGLLGVLGVFVLYLKNHVGVIFKRFARGGLDKVTPALQVVIVSHLLGEHKRDGNRMNSSDSWRCGILGVCPC